MERLVEAARPPNIDLGTLRIRIEPLAPCFVVGLV
jgi:hypothetical protein